MPDLRPYLFHEEPGITLYCGDALTILRGLRDASAQTCVTSPPYWGLRDYGVAGQLGLEPTPDAYVQALVAVFREVRRVLREDGTLWLNLGDSYAGVGAQTGGTNSKERGKRAERMFKPGILWGDVGLKPKDLVGIPWRVAFALQADGWYLRSDIIWHKPNPMPESVTDRPTKAHEYLFLLAKSDRYYYDAEAISEPAKSVTTKMPDGWDTGPGAHGAFHRNGREKGRKTDKQRGHGCRHAGFNDRWDGMEKAEQQSGRSNKRDVWTVATAPFPEAHFATFPPDLIKPCVLAGSRPGDVALDPFVGSGTVAFVAKELNREAIGCDLNRSYLGLAVKRLQQEVLPL